MSNVVFLDFLLNSMVCSIEDILVKLDKCYSVDYSNDEVKFIKFKIEVIVYDIFIRIGVCNFSVLNIIV